MLQRETTWLVILLTAAAVDGLIAFAPWYPASRRSGPGFTFLLAAAFCYTVGYAFALISATVGSRVFWGGVEFLGLAAWPPAWVMTAAAGPKGLSPTRRLVFTLFAVPFASLILYWTNRYHHLYYGAASLAPPGPLALLSPVRGPWYWVFAAWALASLFFGNLLYARRRRERGYGLLLASLLPWTAVLSYFAGVPADPGPLALAVTGLLFGWFWRRPAATPRITRYSVLQGVREGVLVLDAQNRIVDFNPAARSVISGLARQALGRPAEEVLGDQPELLRQLAAPECRPTELQLPQGRGLRCYQSRLSPLVDGRRRVIGKVVILCDITRETWRVDELQARARMDALTGIFNRRYLLELGRQEVERAKARGRAVSVVLIDLDHFKGVNDTYGHSAGDLVLKSAVKICGAALRSRDLLGRWGGEEFAAILPGAPPDGALAVAERMRAELAGSPVALDESTSVGVTASFGVAGIETAGPGHSLEMLLETADRALYRAKNGGRNRVVLARD